MAGKDGYAQLASCTFTVLEGISDILCTMRYTKVLRDREEAKERLYKIANKAINHALEQQKIEFDISYRLGIHVSYTDPNDLYLEFELESDAQKGEAA